MTLYYLHVYYASAMQYYATSIPSLDMSIHIDRARKLSS
jgi:hypothetical protein